MSILAFGENEIILSGPPSSLRGPVILHNSTDEHLFVRELPMKNAQNADAVLPVHTTLKPREIKSQNVYYSIDPLTPPGTYEMNLQIGNESKKVTLIVHENLDVQLSPRILF